MKQSKKTFNPTRWDVIWSIILLILSPIKIVLIVVLIDTRIPGLLKFLLFISIPVLVFYILCFLIIYIKRLFALANLKFNINRSIKKLFHLDRLKALLTLIILSSLPAFILMIMRGACNLTGISPKLVDLYNFFNDTYWGSPFRPIYDIMNFFYHLNIPIIKLLSLCFYSNLYDISNPTCLGQSNFIYSVIMILLMIFDTYVFSCILSETSNFLLRKIKKAK